jgi:hypothetical protein
MKKTYCDVKGCGEEAFNEVDSCMGWLDSSGNEHFKPFQKPTVRKIDLCFFHYRVWCEATYSAFYKLPPNYKKMKE